MADAQGTPMMVMVPSEQQARQQLAAEVKAMRKNPPDRTVPGGRYELADGRVVDANGKEVKAASKSVKVESEGGESGEGSTGALAEDFPSRAVLVEGGFATTESVRAASDEQLLALDGIGPAALKKIRAAGGQ